jgi:hypothetical protein
VSFVKDGEGEPTAGDLTVYVPSKSCRAANAVQIGLLPRERIAFLALTAANSSDAKQERKGDGLTLSRLAIALAAGSRLRHAWSNETPNAVPITAGLSSAKSGESRGNGSTGRECVSANNRTAKQCRRANNAESPLARDGKNIAGGSVIKQQKSQG